MPIHGKKVQVGNGGAAEVRLTQAHLNQIKHHGRHWYGWDEIAHLVPDELMMLIELREAVEEVIDDYRI